MEEDEGGATPGDPVTGPAEGRPVSPRAKRLAGQSRISLRTVQGTGPGGRIIERDVLEEIQKGKKLTPLAQRMVEEGDREVPAKGSTPFGKIFSGELSDKVPSYGKTSLIPGEFRDEPLSGVRRIISAAM